MCSCLQQWETWVLIVSNQMLQNLALQPIHVPCWHNTLQLHPGLSFLILTTALSLNGSTSQTSRCLPAAAFFLFEPEPKGFSQSTQFTAAFHATMDKVADLYYNQLVSFEQGKSYNKIGTKIHFWKLMQMTLNLICSLCKLVLLINVILIVKWCDHGDGGKK